jgi:hypothetical protein
MTAAAISGEPHSSGTRVMKRYQVVEKVPLPDMQDQVCGIRR